MQLNHPAKTTTLPNAFVKGIAMGNKLILSDAPTGLTTLYAQLIESSTGLFLNTSGTPALETYNSGHLDDYAIPLSEIGDSGVYQATFPAAPAAAYVSKVKNQAGGSPAESDPTIAVTGEAIIWDGAAILSMADMAPLAPQRNTEGPRFSFFMAYASDHFTPAVGLSAIAVERSIDGEPFATATGDALAGSGYGVYTFLPSAADQNGGEIVFRFTAAGCDPRLIVIRTRP